MTLSTRALWFSESTNLTAKKFDFCKIWYYQNLCSRCQLGKFTKLPFTNSINKSVAPFAKICCDSSPKLPINKYRYYAEFIDDCSRFVWFYPLHSVRFFQMLANIWEIDFQTIHCKNECFSVRWWRGVCVRENQFTFHCRGCYSSIFSSLYTTTIRVNWEKAQINSRDWSCTIVS